MKAFSLPAILLAFVWAAGASAADGQPAQKGSSAVKTCHAEKVTGSNLRRRICMTDEEREARRKADQETLETFKRGSANSGAADPRLGG
jgi:hypothetical protein